LNGSGETTSQLLLLLLLLLLVGHGRLLLLQNLLLLCYNCFRLARRHSHGSGRNWNVSAERYNLSTTGQLLLLLLLLSEGLQLLPLALLFRFDNSATRNGHDWPLDFLQPQTGNAKAQN
jgi:hypothetical protein